MRGKQYMKLEEGIKLGKIPVKDFIPSDISCVHCGKDECNIYYVKGCAHYKCYCPPKKEENI
jgi:hypothetical protein